MNIPLYIIDTFTSEIFTGNTAGVCPLDLWIPDCDLLNIAAENAYSETAFFVNTSKGYHLRWFTPKTEVELCGHATLASAFVLHKLMHVASEVFVFHTLSGDIKVSVSKDTYYLNLPAREIEPIDTDYDIANCVGTSPINVVKAARTIIAEFANEEQVSTLSPNFEEILNLDCSGLVVTAKGRDVDFVSRFFGPKVGILEDPVTGSAHCGLIPYWAEKLGKRKMVAKQLSERGGTLYCEDLRERIIIGGKAALYSSGEIYLPQNSTRKGRG